MQPLPHVPTATILECAQVEVGRTQRLELWNYLPQRRDEEVLDYIVISVAPMVGGAPDVMISTRLPRRPDPELDAAEGTERLIPAARQSVLTVPLRKRKLSWPDGADDLQISELLLDALLRDVSPWRPTEVEVDGSPIEFRALSWNGGSLCG